MSESQFTDTFLQKNGKEAQNDAAKIIGLVLKMQKTVLNFPPQMIDRPILPPNFVEDLLRTLFCTFSLDIRTIIGSVSRLGDFSSDLTSNFLTKVAQIFGDILGYFEHTAVAIFWAIFGKFWLIFISTSDHTDHWS